MNKSLNKKPRNKLISLRVDEILFAECWEHFRNDLSRCKHGLGRSSADLIEFCLQQYKKQIDKNDV